MKISKEQKTILKTSKKDFKKMGIKVLYLFGSQVSGRVGPLSDIDVAIFAPALSYDERFELKLELIQILMEKLRVEKIDVVVLDDAPLHLADKILRDGELIFSNDELGRRQFEHKIRMQFFDWRWHFDKYVGDILKV